MREMVSIRTRLSSRINYGERGIEEVWQQMMLLDQFLHVFCELTRRSDKIFIGNEADAACNSISFLELRKTS